MIDVIIQKFETEKNTKTYRRINAQHPLDIYLGYNNKGCKSMVVTENSPAVIIRSTKIIETNAVRRTDGKIALEFALLDDMFSNIFYKFCEDTIYSSSAVTKENAIKFFVDRWDAWRLMFQNAKNEYLDDMEIMGLLGELLFIEKTMQPRYGMSRTISSWEGPLGGAKDFVIDETWYEIKASLSSTQTVKIASLEQLDSERLGRLVVIKVDKTNGENNNGINLNMQVDKVRNNIKDIKILNDYIQKLTRVGYFCDDYYTTKCFEYRGMKEYIVDENFPRIQRKNIDRKIVKVQYEISLSE